MIATETRRPIMEFTGSADAIDAVRFTLGEHFDALVEAGGRPNRAAGKLEVYGYASPTGNAVPGSGEYHTAYERWQQDGGIESITIRQNPETGLVSSARMKGINPASLSADQAGYLYRSDVWHTKIGFPSENQDQNGKRLVIDSYVLPYTHLSLAMGALEVACTRERQEAYEEMYANMFRTDKFGFPIGAVAIKHIVFGRDNFLLRDNEAQQVNNVMDTAAQGVARALNFMRHVDADDIVAP